MSLLVSFTIIGFLAVPAWFIYQRFNRRSFLKDEEKRSSWQKLAAANNLVFVPGHYQALGGAKVAYISGDYRGHDLKLDTFVRAEDDDKYHTYTRLVVSLKKGRFVSGAASLQNILDEQLTPTDVVRQITSVSSASARGEVLAQANGHQVCYEQREIEDDIDYLQALFNALSRVADGYANMLALGGEAAPTLQELAAITEPKLRQTAIQLLRGIAEETQQRLADQASQLLCPHCFVRCGPHKVNLSWFDSLTYYGCRICRQSRKFLKGHVVAVLNTHMEKEWFEQDGTLHVNWLARRTLFDFDGVVIAKAGDEEIERFMVQVGNDTDPTRQPRYQHMRCAISSHCRLSQNTRRILERMFGEIIIG